MTTEDSLVTPISIEDLLHYKALGTVAPADLKILEEIQKLDVSDFTEAEVRAAVIDPIVRILGYQKGKDFSYDLERHIQFRGKTRIPDYKLTCWKENFWVIEAKRPRLQEDTFDYEDLRQGIEYAIHPEINAALVVLCDGQKIEIFDREVSVMEPALHVFRRNLIRDFDKLRVLLEPWQVWFFQKRRVARMIDKVFNKEFNLERVNEFKRLIDRRLESKRQPILDNFRKISKSGPENYKKYIYSSTTADLVDVHFFLRASQTILDLICETLSDRSRDQSFQVLHKIFPDNVRDANDIYYGYALAFLIKVDEKNLPLYWLPAWLTPQAGQRSTAEAIRRLIRLCLSYFEDDHERKIILLAAAAFRRLFKLLFVSHERFWNHIERAHIFERFVGPETTWKQFVSSPGEKLIEALDQMSMSATQRFVQLYRNPCGRLNTETAKIQLKDMWKLETVILSKVNYRSLEKERNIGERFATEAQAVCRDNLASYALHIVSSSPRWAEFSIDACRPEVELLASMGEAKALGLLSLPAMANPSNITLQHLADRYFFRDQKILELLLDGYSLRGK